MPGPALVPRDDARSGRGTLVISTRQWLITRWWGRLHRLDEGDAEEQPRFARETRRTGRASSSGALANALDPSSSGTAPRAGHAGDSACATRASAMPFTWIPSRSAAAPCDHHHDTVPGPKAIRRAVGWRLGDSPGASTICCAGELAGRQPWRQGRSDTCPDRLAYRRACRRRRHLLHEMRYFHLQLPLGLGGTPRPGREFDTQTHPRPHVHRRQADRQ